MSTPSGVPLPAKFYNLMKVEWEAPAKPKASHPYSKFYSLTLEAVKRTKLSVVDDPATSLASSSVLPMDAEGIPMTEGFNRPLERTLRHLPYC